MAGGGREGGGERQAAGPAPGRVDWGWLEVVGRAVESGKTLVMESLWMTVGAAKHGCGLVAAAPVGANGPRGCGGPGGRRLPSPPAALGAAAEDGVGAGGPGQRSTVNPMKWKPIPSVRVWLTSSSQTTNDDG
uniref:Uncharacterized protein n=1 Tax=Oryza rufipogon TaxID=4529 RepID=A0A0E0RJG6_ORYRU